MPASSLSQQGHFLGAGYVFYERLLEDGRKYGRYELINVYNGVNRSIKQVIKGNNRQRIRLEAANQLETMAAAEQQKERMLIKSQLGIDGGYSLDDPSSVKKFTEDLAACLGLKAHHLRNVERIVNRKKNQKMISISKFIVTYQGEGYFNRKVGNIFSNRQNKQKIKNAILNGTLEDVIRDLYENALDNTVRAMMESLVFKGKETSPFLDEAYLSVLELFKKDPAYKDSFYGQLRQMLNVEDCIEKAKESILNASDINKACNEMKKTVSIKGDGIGKIQGEMEEMVLEAVVKAFSGLQLNSNDGSISGKIEAGKYGQTGRKTDVYITVGANIGIIDSTLQHKSISREQALNEATDLAEKLSQLSGGFVVNENAKNYTMGREFDTGAFSGAGGLNFLRTLYNKLGKGSEAEQIFNAIKNVGAGTVGSAQEGLKQLIKDSLSADVAYALFDDYDALGVVKSSGSQQLHILDLNGTQITLSLYLSLLARALRKAANDLTENANEFVRVELNPAKAIYENLPFEGFGVLRDMGIDPWEKQKEYSDANSLIDMHFMKSFEQVVNEYLS